MSAPLDSRIRGFIASRTRWWLGLALLALHGALVWDIGAGWRSALLLAHFGLFLLWQPMWHGERRPEPRHAALVAAIGLVLTLWGNGWLMAVWLAVLFGLIGGSVPGMADRRQRLVSILAAFHLLSLLLIWVVPHLFAEPALEPALIALVRFGLPAIPLAIMLIRVDVRRSAEAPPVVDLVSGLLLFLLVIALGLGSFVVKEVSHGNYPVALAQTLLVIALLLIALSWLWNPRGGFAGLGHLLSRYLMSLGLPFERWVQQLADLAEREPEAHRFLAAALQHVLDLPWVSGVQWQARSGSGELGVRTPHAARFSARGVELEIFTRWALSPALLLHLKLLAQMVGYFYEAKRREQIQRQNAYAQAIYETGARLTHDVKNLLQSLRSLCAAAETSSGDQASQLQALMQRQLPVITQRLNTTLEKLRNPREVDPGEVDSTIWWEGLVQRYQGRSIRFGLDGEPRNIAIPSELFDSVADNLIENALRKRADGGDLRVEVRFAPSQGIVLTVCDNGAAVAPGVASQLFTAPVASRTGLGVGLYHAAQQAQRLGYRLSLTANEPGCVCFALMREEVGPRDLRS
jgi:signal transduction histidine kinase